MSDSEESDESIEFIDINDPILLNEEISYYREDLERQVYIDVPFLRIVRKL